MRSRLSKGGLTRPGLTPSRDLKHAGRTGWEWAEGDPGRCLFQAVKRTADNAWPDTFVDPVVAGGTGKQPQNKCEFIPRMNGFQNEGVSMRRVCVSLSTTPDKR